MISSLDSAAQSFLTGLGQIQQRLDTAQTELTTGLAINDVTDAPDQMPNLWQTRSDLVQVQQVNSNLGQVSTEVNTAQSVLQTAVSLVEQAETLGSEGASGTSDAQSQQDLAGQLGSVLQQLVGIANTTVEGRYIFSGNSDQTAPYSIDLTQTNPISAYQGSAATRQALAPDGSTFSISLTAQQIFDSSDGSQNVFTSINNLREALLNGDTAGASSAMSDVQSADAYLNQQLAFYGTVQDRVASATDFGQTYVTELQSQLSGIEDANEAADITNLTQAQTQLQAALESEASLPQKTLFDYLA
ncbi:MAG TPA: flagellin [Bryobacteraceae bacterium]|nr:flagellin [Bryobacteraceae bacterium]